MLGAYLITAFFFIHVYLTTTGHTVFAHIKAMITGWEEVDDHHDAKGAKTRQGLSGRLRFPAGAAGHGGKRCRRECRRASNDGTFLRGIASSRFVPLAGMGQIKELPSRLDYSAGPMRLVL